MDYSKSIENAYIQRKKCIIIGLTGRTGSGCSTVASILSKKFSQLDLKGPKEYDFENTEERKYSIIHRFIKNKWCSFTTIEASSIIFSYIIQKGKTAFKEFLSNYKTKGIAISAFDELIKTIDRMDHMFKDNLLCNLEELKLEEIGNNKLNEYYNFYIKKLPKYKREFKELLSDYTCHEEYSDKFNQSKKKKSHLYTFLLQQVGNNIRCSGNPFDLENVFSQENYYDVAKKINDVIDLVQYNDKKNKNETRICIDAIRNPYEAFYFKDRYSAFYLISVNTDDEARKKRLSNLDSEELWSLDSIEYPQKFDQDYEMFFHQNILGCLEISDIHLYNPQQNIGKHYFLSEQLIKYISLMLHPGLVTPSGIERCMQLAYISKLNSGCLSRKVGAIITGPDFSVKAVGWNDIPKGQIPCNLRDINNYCNNKDSESYSSYEIKDKDFQDTLYAIKKEINKETNKGIDRNLPYCFKDIYNSLTNQDNQVYTRSLHAEENAFLQLAKYSSGGIQGGFLFTTASPCELCSKKAYQLGIKKIYYIDPYPGISMQHILKFGSKNNPEMNLFYGTIGFAYVSLYIPRIPIKDELKLVTGINFKKAIEYRSDKGINQLSMVDIEYTELNLNLIFETRESIYRIDDITIKALRDDIKEIPIQVYWTGSSLESIEILDSNREYNFEMICSEESPYLGLIKLEEPLKNGEKFRYKTKSSVKDITHSMIPFFSKTISNRITNFSLKLQDTRKNIIDKDSVTSVVYADKDMNSEMKIESKKIEKKKNGTVETYTYKLKTPTINHSYCLEWRFMK